MAVSVLKHWANFWDISRLRKFILIFSWHVFLYNYCIIHPWREQHAWDPVASFLGVAESESGASHIFGALGPTSVKWAAWTESHAGLSPTQTSPRPVVVSPSLLRWAELICDPLLLSWSLPVQRSSLWRAVSPTPLCGMTHQPLLLPLVASGQHTAGTARSEASVGPPNPHLSPVEGWDDSSKYGFSEPCSSCRGQEGKGRGNLVPVLRLKVSSHYPW